ncbi:hypothetical protein B0H17DRAFT_1161714 [Mycena rosella]|uniref:Chitin-binding type-3 domain-containing protein n=1 Tax=Mycena rosella TaxID=1033263 RepID=A0AAD7D1V6_MYCRO|nr:hypothetical protein B0H17DRAFT_1161714 [Mycena rosella]
MQYWEPGTLYSAGSVIEYEGHRYKIIQPHTSQSDWAPNLTPALWGRMDDHDGGEYQQQHHGGQQYGGQQQFGGQQHGGHHGHSDSEKHHSEGHGEDRPIGGGLLAGAALLAGGYAAFKGHEKNEEEKKAQTWALQNWIHDAEARTAQFRQYGPRSPATWILNHGKNIPQGAIAVGQEHSWTLYICRAFYEGFSNRDAHGLLEVGKASDAFQKGGVIGFKHDEIHVDTYEILVGDINGLRWVDASGRLDVSGLGFRPVEGGREADGTPLYIAEAPHKGAVHPGKASEKLDGAYIPYDGGETNVKSYRVLCYA